MDTLKLKKEDRVSKEDLYVALVNKAKEKALEEAEMKQLETLEGEIAKLDAEIESLERAEKKAMEIAKRQSKSFVPGAPQDDASEKKELGKLANEYRVAKAFQNILNRKDIDGVEKEVFEIAQAEAKEQGHQLSGNIAIPQKFIQIGKRKLLDVATEGTDVVFTEYGGKVIPFLNPDPVAAQMGVNILSGLRGDVQWPRNNGHVAFSWETETADVDETTPTFNNISISPKRVGGYVDISMQMLKQSIFVVEPFIRQALQDRYALTIDHVVFNGLGASNQPAGLFNYNGVNVLSLGSSGGDMTYNALLSMMRDTQSANARMGREAFITNPYGVHALSTTPKQTSGVEGNFIYSGNGPLVGVPLYKSTTIPSNFEEGGSGATLSGIIYSSNWGAAILGTWGGLDLLFDPYTQALGGKVRFVANAFMDFEVEQPVEFTICKDWTAAAAPALT